MLMTNHLSYSWASRILIFHREDEFFLPLWVPSMRVHNRFGGMRDLAYFGGDIRDKS